MTKFKNYKANIWEASAKYHMRFQKMHSAFDIEEQVFGILEEIANSTNEDGADLLEGSEGREHTYKNLS